MITSNLSTQYACTTGSDDLLLGILAKELSLHDAWKCWETALAQNLEDALGNQVDDWSLAALGGMLLLCGGDGLLAGYVPQVLDVQDWHVVRVLGVVEVAHADLSEVSRMAVNKRGQPSLLVRSWR